MELQLQTRQVEELLGVRSYLLGMRLREICEFSDIGFEYKERSTMAMGYVDDVQVAVEMDYLHEQVGVRTFCGDCLEAESCEHLGAFLLELVNDYPDDFMVNSDPGARANGTLPQWYRAINKSVPPVPVENDEDIEPLALMLSVNTGYRGALSRTVRVRPMRPGARGGWIQTGVSWSHLYGDPRFGREQRAALVALHGLQRATQYYYQQQDDAWMVLNDVPGPQLVESFRKLIDVGVVIVDDSPARKPIEFLPGELTPLIDLRRTDAGLSVQAQLTGSAQQPWDMLGIGRPAQLALLSANEPDKPSAQHLSVLGTTLSTELLNLAEQGRIEVPTEDIARFESTLLGRLRRIAPLVSPDGSYRIPDPVRPALEIGLQQDRSTLRVSYSWSYADGGDRDRKLETGILAGITDKLGEHTRILGVPINGKFLDTVMNPGLALEFILNALPLLREHPDVRIIEKSPIPEYRLTDELPQVTVEVDSSSNDWFDLAVAVTLGGEPVPFAELFTALNDEQPYMVLPSGTVLNLDDKQFSQLRALIAEAGELADVRNDGVRMHKLNIDWWQELLALGIIETQENDWLQTMRQLGPGAQLEQPQLPSDFTPTLRDYQQHGTAWLHFLRTHQLGGVLADDMGLGKTVQLLAALEAARLENPDQKFLVVAPTSVAGNWYSEAARFAPQMRTALLAETSKKRGLSVAEAVDIAHDAQLVITSYAVFRLDFESFDELDFSVLILDEAQQLKNHTSKGYKQARQMVVPCKFVVTGTPVENNLLELWALVSLAAPGLLGGLKAFKDNYAKPIAEGRTDRLQRLKSRLRPFVLRRTKEQVATDLPAKTEQILEVELDPAHRKAYDRRFARVRQEILGLVEDVDSNRFRILQSLTLLRQLALDPSLVDEGDAPSAKLQLLGELLADAVAEGHKVLVFSQFTGFLAKARDVAERLGVQTGYLDGSTSQKNRRKLIDGFTEGQYPVFFISLKAGGFGINLTAADYCILLDPWWNPAAEAQAVDRAHRIGQTRPVHVYRLVAKGTIESKVLALQEKKTRLFNDVLGEQTETGQSNTLSADDFLALME
ncbi:SNF2 family helicase [Glutamicibacter sp. MNS18]|uniref:DEAD/DEAH box helicase n=1 Tax=Glutamicibacter sp. MNS18 TaxID=2989817 RepID=UPI002236062C|nr:DEAD/DEAH box helicase [Glutamicibacter sp. MNS18]MCW4465641.1 SNF2 family helicase [Glutamicibacter sp. MNS18]